jgi:hypothetical protein
MRPEHSDCPCPVCAQFRHGQDVDGVLLVGLGLAMAMVGLIWLAGQVAGLLAGGGWQEVSLAELPGMLARLPRHLADPAGAWPAAVRGRLPGPAGMYAALALLFAVAVVLGTLAVWWRRRRTTGPWPATPRRGRLHRDPSGRWGALR